MRFALKHAALAVACMAAFPVHATNGYFLPGFGIRSQGMGGVGIAFGRDSLSTAANPANAVNTGMRGDMGFAVFNPERHTSVGVDAGGASPFFFNGNVESDAKYFIIPEMGFSMPLTDRLHVALAVVGSGGMNTTYPENFFSWNGTVPPSDTKLGVDMMQLLVPISVAYKVNENHSFGASLVLAETRFRAYGLQAFQYFDSPPPGFNMTITSDPAHLTNQGFDYSYGAGIKLGWLGEFMDDKLTVGLAYASRTYMTKFDKYRGLFAEQGGFDIPENYGIGIAIKPVKNLVIAADVTHINYADVKAVGDLGPGIAQFPNGFAAALAIPSVTDASKELGNDNGMGFGWNNQTVYKLGVQYGVNNRLLLRAGYNYGKSPIPNYQLTFNTLAPATVERHYTAGFTYKANDTLEVTGTYMYAAPNNQSGCAQSILNCVEIGMHQNMFGLTLGWVLDPGPVATEEYGDDDWAGINFDGWYAGFGFGQSQYQGVSSYLDSQQAAAGKTSTTSANTRTEGWKVYAGYQFNKYIGVEGGYANLNDMSATTTITAPTAGSVRTNMDSDAWTLAAVGSYPLTDKFSILGKLGAAYVLTDNNVKVNSTTTQHHGDDGYQPYYGVGVSYALVDNFKLRAEWERFDLNDINIDLLTAGFTVAF
jgi:long-chain fatty acid transport protein